MNDSSTSIATDPWLFPKAFFVTGTDTDVGKTIVSAILAHGLDAHYWKPVQSGLEPQSDSDRMRELGLADERIFPETHVFTQPLSPHLAARIDAKSISLEDFCLPALDKCKHLLIEGAGGLLVPLNEKDKVIDLIEKLQLPVLLVARTALGTINHTLLSLEALRARQIPIIGVIMSGEPNEENRLAIEEHGKVQVIAQIPLLPDLKKENLIACFKRHFKKGAVLSCK